MEEGVHNDLVPVALHDGVVDGREELIRIRIEVIPVVVGDPVLVVVENRERS